MVYIYWVASVSGQAPTQGAGKAAQGQVGAVLVGLWSPPRAVLILPQVKLSPFTTTVPAEHPHLCGTPCIHRSKGDCHRPLCTQWEERGWAGLLAASMKAKVLDTGGGHMAWFARVAKLPCRGMGEPGCSGSFLPRSSARAEEGCRGQSTATCLHLPCKERTITGCYFVCLREFLALKPV